MKRTLAIIALTIGLLGCATRGDDAIARNNNAAKSEPTPIVKAVDIPSLIDKSPTEVKRIVGVEGKLDNDGTTYHQTLRFDLPQGGLFLQYKNGKQASITFTFQFPSDGSKSGFTTAESFCQFVGVDLKGKTPAAQVPGSDHEDEDDYTDVTINGKKIHRIELLRSAPHSYFRIDLYPHG